MDVREIIEKPAPNEMISYCLNWCPLLEKMPAPFVAGGFIRDFFIDKNPSDMDIYFRNSVSFAMAQEIMDESNLYEVAYDTDRALTYHCVDGSKCAVQLIRYTYASPDTILSDFDFTVCMAGLDFVRRVFLHHQRFLIDLKRGRLIFNASPENFKLSSLARVVKFVSRGYVISNEDLYRLAEAIAEAGPYRVRAYRERHCRPQPNDDNDLSDDTVLLHGGGDSTYD